MTICFGQQRKPCIPHLQAQARREATGRTKKLWIHGDAFDGGIDLKESESLIGLAITSCCSRAHPNTGNGPARDSIYSRKDLAERTVAMVITQRLTDLGGIEALHGVNSFAMKEAMKFSSR